MSSLSAEKAFLEADLPTRQYRSFSFALPSSLKDPAEVDPAHARAMAAFRARAADMSLREAPETGDMTEEEYNGIPKGRSRSKSSSAIYGLPGDSFDGSDDPVAAAVAAANLAMQSGPGSQMPDMSALWRDANRPQESYHRRASTQPNHQTLMWEALRSSHLATANDMNGVYTEELLDRYRQQHAAQMRRFSVAPSVLNRYINNNVDHSPDMVGMGGTPAGYDMGRRRHSLAGTTFDRKINTRDVAEGLEAMGLNDQLSQIDDYFDNTENRVRAWSEAGKNLQMNNHTSALSPVALMSPAVHYTLKFPLYVVEFKAGRTDFFFLADDSLGPLSLGDLVIVEADRGKDLGKIIENNINSPQELQLYQATHTDALIDTHIGNKEVQPKRIFRLSAPQEIAMLLGKSQDEAKAMGVCQVKIRQKKLPMEIVDAEYQWDRRKLTFYFVAERRVDFRELVRELFKIYKTRIWMCAVSSKTPGLESAPQSPQLYENDPPAE
ncbi:PSP1 C-terminal conserved region-domain-containing protein [Entophlyctis helioformis]|nr:PSP1 C-terminal conserved region-domain-containing protein [Entophlyctis helioformis]